MRILKEIKFQNNITLLDVCKIKYVRPTEKLPLN